MYVLKFSDKKETHKLPIEDVDTIKTLVEALLLNHIPFMVEYKK